MINLNSISRNYTQNDIESELKSSLAFAVAGNNKDADCVLDRRRENPIEIHRSKKKLKLINKYYRSVYDVSQTGGSTPFKAALNWKQSKADSGE